MTQTTLEPQVLTCATCPYFQPHNDGTNKGWCNLFNHFARESHQQTQDCVNNISDEQAIAQAELDQHIQEQAQEIAPGFEIDSDVDQDFGVLYRVWSSYHLLGTFYQDVEGKWVAQPCNSDFRPRLNTSMQAELVIIALSGFLVAEAA